MTDRFPRSTEVQSLVFSKEYFTRAQAKKWAKEHGFKYGKVDETENTWRLRQTDPDDYDKDTFRYKTFKQGIRAVVAMPLENPNGSIFSVGSKVRLVGVTPHHPIAMGLVYPTQVGTVIDIVYDEEGWTVYVFWPGDDELGIGDKEHGFTSTFDRGEPVDTGAIELVEENPEDNPSYKELQEEAKKLGVKASGTKEQLEKRLVIYKRRKAAIQKRPERKKRKVRLSQIIRDRLEDWAEDNDVSLGDTHVYSVKQWQARGENEHGDAVAYITSEGTLWQIWNGYLGDIGEELLDSFYDMLAGIKQSTMVKFKYGLSFDHVEPWAIAIHPKYHDDDDDDEEEEEHLPRYGMKGEADLPVKFLQLPPEDYEVNPKRQVIAMPLENPSYKELQEEAKKLGVKASGTKEQLEKRLKIYRLRKARMAAKPTSSRRRWVRRVERLLESFADKNGLSMGDTIVYSPKAWADRGEEVVDNAVAYITSEGDMYMIWNGHHGEEWQDTFYNMWSRLRTSKVPHGLEVVELENWSIALVPATEEEEEEEEEEYFARYPMRGETDMRDLFLQFPDDTYENPGMAQKLNSAEVNALSMHGVPKGSSLEGNVLVIHGEEFLDSLEELVEKAIDEHPRHGRVLMNLQSKIVGKTKHVI